MIRGSPRTPDRLPELLAYMCCTKSLWDNGSTCGPYDLGNSTTAGIGACHYSGCCSTNLQNFKKNYVN
jgi:hypothetical protein